MSVKVGDHLLIDGGQSGGGRVCEALEIRGDNGPWRFVVRWMDSGLHGLVILDRGDMVVTAKAA
jgi:hypothetical protein